MTGPKIRPTQYSVSLLPEDDINHGAFEITVEYRGDGRWAVMHKGFCLGTDGDWEFEPGSSSRTDAWLATHRFELTRALDLAAEVAPGVEVNGMTASDALRRGSRRRAR